MEHIIGKHDYREANNQPNKPFQLMVGAYGAIKRQLLVGKKENEQEPCRDKLPLSPDWALKQPRQRTQTNSPIPTDNGNQTDIYTMMER